jgi:flagellar biosynthetic protein FlhB
VLEKRSLARYLYRHIEVGQGIPESLFSAVAEVLAYVYKVKKKYKSIGLPAHLRGAS